MDRILKKNDALDRFFNNTVAKSEDRTLHLFQKRGKSGVPIKGKYVLLKSIEISAENDEEAMLFAEDLIINNKLEEL